MLREKIYSIINNGNIRSVKAKKNIIVSFGLKGISIIIGLIYVPILINYLGVEEYGVWLTISSIVGWFSFFDIGLGNGLKNKLTEALAHDKLVLAKEYISTTYALISSIFLLVLIIFYFINPLLNWSKILNTTTIDSQELSLLALIIFTFFILRFIFNLIGIIYTSHQMTAVNNAYGPIGNILSLATILILIKTTEGSLVTLGFLLSFIPVLVLMIASFIAFNGRFKELRPSILSINLKHSKGLLSLGVKFFIYQIAAIILFSTSNIIIAQVLTQKDVAIYNVAFKYFSVSLMVISVVLSPIWPAVTDAYAKNDFEWLKATLKKLNLIGFIFILIVLIQLLFSDFIFEIWIGDTIKIPFLLSIAFFFDIGWSCFSAAYGSFINGLGKLRLGLIIVCFRLAFFIPLAIYLTKEFGVSGIVWASFIGKIFTIFIVIQVYKIINKKAYGIWNK